MKKNQQVKKIGSQPFKILVILSIAVFALELCIMMTLDYFFYPLSPMLRNLLDSSLLTTALFPLLYLLVFRPLVFEIDQRRRSQEMLQQGYNQLDARVEEQTAALRKSNEELQKTQRELIHSEKLAALGRFSSGVAHEIKNPLGIILGGIEFLSTSFPAAGEDVKTALEKIEEATMRADTIVQGLLKFSRPGELKFIRIRPDAIIQEALSLFVYRLRGSNIEIKTDFAEEEIFVDVDKDQIQQVIFNILMNSMDAMPDGGEVSIKVQKTSLAEFSGSVACIIEINDTGTGIKGEDFHKIFEPFFTTKRAKKGTGLGLTIAKAIIENHGGRLMLESEYGKGTKVSIVLPVSLKEAENTGGKL